MRIENPHFRIPNTHVVRDAIAQVREGDCMMDEKAKVIRNARKTIAASKAKPTKLEREQVREIAKLKKMISRIVVYVNVVAKGPKPRSKKA